MSVKPILRWAGGKIWLTNHIANYVPLRFNNYFEPFIGGASIFLFLKSNGIINKQVHLSDSNSDLINAHIVIRDQPSELFEVLSQYKNEKEFYYEMRNSAPETQLEKAAKFLYLNRTSFNGIYRENLRGEYNVPFGNRAIKTLFEKRDLVNVSSLMQGTNISSCDFEELSDKIGKKDLVFLDPPYTVAHENNGFIKYNKKIFAWKDQERLCAFVEEIKRKGAYFILTNAAHSSISDLYGNLGRSEKLCRASLIGGKGAKRETYNEFIFFNTK